MSFAIDPPHGADFFWTAKGTSMEKAEGKRLLFVDTETTGLKPEEGHRVWEISMREMIDGELTGNNYHARFNPEREMDPNAQAVHGVDSADLVDCGRFADSAQEIRDYMQDGVLVAHNSPFDVGFLNNEMRIAGYPDIDGEDGPLVGVIDTRAMSKELWPEQSASLDNVCARLGVDTSERTKHGAEIDTLLLCWAYGGMESKLKERGREAGRQEDRGIDL